VEVPNVVGIALECLRHLERQLPRGGQHQDLGLLGREVDARQERQREGGGLAGTGLGLAQEVAALQ
jgi:hypothetical protein